MPSSHGVGSGAHLVLSPIKSPKRLGFLSFLFVRRRSFPFALSTFRRNIFTVRSCAFLLSLSPLHHLGFSPSSLEIPAFSFPFPNRDLELFFLPSSSVSVETSISLIFAVYVRFFFLQFPYSILENFFRVSSWCLFRFLGFWSLFQCISSLRLLAFNDLCGFVQNTWDSSVSAHSLSGFCRVLA